MNDKLRHYSELAHASKLQARVAELENSLLIAEHKFDVQHALNLGLAEKCDELAARLQVMRLRIDDIAWNRKPGDTRSKAALLQDAERMALDVLAMPDLAADILRKRDRKRDVETLRKAFAVVVGKFDRFDVPFTLHELRKQAARLAAELEAAK